jgi:KDO2-lipid IV(A) lauroyltransferase
MERAGRGHYVIRYRTICEDARTMSVEDIMKRYYELLEEDIRKQPENYLWSHRRWA